MTTAASMFSVAGYQAIGNWNTPDTVQRHPLGTITNVVDPYWGGQELMYVQFAFTTGTALRTGAVMAYDVASSFTATLVANTQNLGKSVGFNLNSIPSANASGTYYLWIVISGSYVAYSSASVAADTAIGIVAAGQAGTLATGKQLVNCRSTRPSSTTVAKANTVTQNGSPILKVFNTDGWFVGGSVSGTGITTSLITAIDPDNRTVTLASNASATGSVTATQTFNDGTAHFNTVTFNRPFAQGAIT